MRIEPPLPPGHSRNGTAYPGLISRILAIRPGPAEPGSLPVSRGGLAGIVPPGLAQLTDSETRVLRYLPTHLTVQDIASELFLSVNTVNTHRRHVYAKLGVHSRHEAVDRARALGLLAPSPRRS